jgi:hypothetical protein
MAKTIIEQITFSSSDSKGSAVASYVTATSTLNTPIQIAFSGQKLIFQTAADYLTFFTEVLLPLTDTLHSSSGTAQGFVAASSGTAGSDALHN